MPPSIFEPNTLWKRKAGSYQHVVYELLHDNGAIVSYIVHGKKMVARQCEVGIWERDFVQLGIDETIIECSIL